MDSRALRYQVIAERIAELEGLSDAPRQLVSKVMSQRPVDMRTLTRIAEALNVQTYCLILSEEEFEAGPAGSATVHKEADDSSAPAPATIQSEIVAPAVLPAASQRAKRFNVAVYMTVALALLIGAWLLWHSLS